MCLLGLPVAARAITINPVYDSTVTALPNAATVEGAFGQAAQRLASLLPGPQTVNVTVSWGRVASYSLTAAMVGASVDNLYGYYSYGQVRSFLASVDTSPAAAAALTALPATLPMGNVNFVVPSAEAKALNLISATATGIDGYVGFSGNSQTAFTYSTTSAPAKGTYDFQAVAVHELSEVLGRISGWVSATPAWLTPLDLFRYASPGKLTSLFPPAAYFSADGGVTDLANFNGPSGGDRGDWLTLSASRDVDDAFVGTGQALNLTIADLAALQLIGWTGGGGSVIGTQPPGTVVLALATAVPEPASWLLLGAGLLVLAASLRRPVNFGLPHRMCGDA